MLTNMPKYIGKIKIKKKQGRRAERSHEKTKPLSKLLCAGRKEDGRGGRDGESVCYSITLLVLSRHASK